MASGTPPRLPGTYRHDLAAARAAWSSRSNPLDTLISTFSAVPSTEISTWTTGLPCSPRRRLRAGYSGFGLLRYCASEMGSTTGPEPADALPEPVADPAAVVDAEAEPVVAVRTPDPEGVAGVGGAAGAAMGVGAGGTTAGEAATGATGVATGGFVTGKGAGLATALGTGAGREGATGGGFGTISARGKSITTNRGCGGSGVISLLRVRCTPHRPSACSSTLAVSARLRRDGTRLAVSVEVMGMRTRVCQSL